MDGCFSLDPAYLRSHIARAALVFDDEIDTLDHDSILAAISVRLPPEAVDLVAVNHSVDRTLQLPTFAPGGGCIPTSNNFDCIAPFDPFHVSLSSSRHKTSGASDMIFT
jgi:hypothetical protein